MQSAVIPVSFIMNDLSTVKCLGLKKAMTYVLVFKDKSRVVLPQHLGLS